MRLQQRFDNIIDCIERLIKQSEKDIPQALSKETGLNLRQLGDSFQFITGITLNRYIRQRRIINALSNRKKFNLSIEQVAFDAGFSDAAAFSKACKNEFKVPPIKITKEVLLEYGPLTFSQVIHGEDGGQMENNILNNTTKYNKNSYISSKQFDEVKQILELGALHGLSDEEAKKAYRISKRCNATLTQAAEFYEDYKLQIENFSIISRLDVFELAELACHHNLSVSESQTILCELEAAGYKSIHDLPKYFFDIYFNEHYEEFGEYSVPYICKVAIALEKNGFLADDIEEIIYYAMMFDVDFIEIIENYDTYIEKYDTEMDKIEIDLIWEDDLEDLE